MVLFKKIVNFNGQQGGERFGRGRCHFNNNNKKPACIYYGRGNHTVDIRNTDFPLAILEMLMLTLQQIQLQ